MKKNQEYLATGRRKTSVASVRLIPGKGAIRINGKNLEEYFPLQIQRDCVLMPLKASERLNSFDMVIRVKGGGLEGQVIATRLGIARALVKEDIDSRPDLKALGYLTRDPRKRERKKYGRVGARKRFQFSKR